MDPDFRLLFESLPGHYLVMSPRFVIVAVSDTYLAATRAVRESVLGKHIFEAFPDNPGDPSASGSRNLRASLERVVASGEVDFMAVQKYDIRLPESEGGGFEERFWKPADYPVKGRDGRLLYIVHTVEDVTEFVRLRDENAEQFQAQKLESIGRLASGIAHDFNNLLTVIVAECSMLAGELPPEDTRQGRVRAVVDAANRAASLTNQLLAFARKQVMETRLVDLAEVVRNAVPLLRRLIRENITMRVEVKPGPVMADTGQLDQVLMNLAINARDAMPQGGELAIAIAHETVANNDRPAGLATGDYVVLVVRDTGAGMPEEVRRRIFEPFFTTKHAGRGTGLGLATCQGIVAQFGGAITVESEAGKGSTFRVYLPMTTRGPESGHPSAVDAPGGPAMDPTTTATVLLAEDEPMVRDILSTMLRRSGYTVLEAPDGEQALAVAERHGAPIDVLVSDALMPKLGGHELARRLMDRNPDLKVIFVSGYNDESLMNYEPMRPSISMLPKPFAPSALIARVAEMLRRRPSGR
jgi:signal transduction histidine kinase